MPGKRRATLRSLAEAVAEDRLDLSVGADRQQTEAQLLALSLIRPWTAGYIAMRALGDPDGWPSGDLVLRQSVTADGDPLVSSRELDRRAENWRPWRGYAAMLLWATSKHRTPQPTDEREGSDQ